MTDRDRPGGLSRRAFIGGGIGMTALAPLLASCGTGSTVGSQQANEGVKLPTYIRYAGGNPDIAGTGKIPDVYFRYPDSPKKLFSSPPGNGGTVSGLVQTYGAVPPAEPDNQFWQYLNKQSGVDWKLTIVPAADFPNKFATGTAGDDLGDAYTVYTPFANLPSFLEAKAADLTPYLSGDNIKKYPYLANIPTDSWRLGVYNGKIYGIPVPRGVLGSQIPLVRADLFEKRGVDPTWKSADDFLAMCSKMTDERRNTWALTYLPFAVLQQIFDGPAGWREKGGKFTNYIEVDAITEALNLGQKLVKAGVVHPDAFAAGSNLVQPAGWFAQGSGALHYDNYASLGFHLNAGKSIPGFQVRPMPNYNDAGDPARMFLNSPNNTVSAIKKASPSRIRDILTVLNWLAAPFGTKEWLDRKYGIEGRDYTLESGVPTSTPTGVSETQNAGFAIQYLTDAPAPVFLPGHDEVAKAVNAQMKIAIPRGILDPTLGLYSQTASTKGGAIGAQVNDAITATLQGRRSVSSFSSVVSRWRSSGGDQIRKEFEKAFAQRNG